MVKSALSTFASLAAFQSPPRNEVFGCAVDEYVRRADDASARLKDEKGDFGTTATGIKRKRLNGAVPMKGFVRLIERIGGEA